MRLLSCVTPTAARTLRDRAIIDRRVREAVRGLIAWTVIAYPHPSFRKHRREGDRETYRGAIGDVDSAKVRSAVGRCRRAYLGYCDGLCQCGYLVTLPPTAARTLRNRAIIDRRVREAVLVLIAWTEIAYPCPSFCKQRREEDRETYQGAIRHTDSVKVRSAVGLYWREYLGY
ncbi:MAG: hypothetical protein RL240_4403 [Planctomycetota bacterium]|jgi:hypothetical protein